MSLYLSTCSPKWRVGNVKCRQNEDTQRERGGKNKRKLSCLVNSSFCCLDQLFIIINLKFLVNFDPMTYWCLHLSILLRKMATHMELVVVTAGQL